MARDFPNDSWALILGGSSSFGLATAQKLAENGMNLLIVHRDRRGSMKRIEPEFEKLRGLGPTLKTWNTDAISAEKRDEVLAEVVDTLGDRGRVRVLLHSIAFGNLKLIAPEKRVERTAPASLAARLGVDPEALSTAADELLADGEDGLHTVTHAPQYPDRYLDEEDFGRTILSMGTSLLGWVQGLFERGLFADDARSERQYVQTVVFDGLVSGVYVVDGRGFDSGNLAGRDRCSSTGAAYDDAAFCLAGHYGSGDGRCRIRIV